jgi:hypothetical protein
MRKVIVSGVLVVLVLLLANTVPSEAGGPHVSFSFGFPLWVGPGWWGPPYHSYPAPPVVVQQPPAYVQPEPAPPAQAPAYWYYCPNPQGYYPYVQQCPNGWMQVVPSAPPR